MQPGEGHVKSLRELACAWVWAFGCLRALTNPDYIAIELFTSTHNLT
jgi:hypothetical protein